MSFLVVLLSLWVQFCWFCIPKKHDLVGSISRWKIGVRSWSWAQNVGLDVLYNVLEGFGVDRNRSYAVVA